jgi:hypothetical protein
MEEKFLYHIWDAGHLLTPLKTASGKPLQVTYQGQFNTDRGPDFRNVIVNLAGEAVRGDVEIHINAYDWTAHDHHEDPYYNNVILHVVMNAGQQQYTIREDGTAIEVLELAGQLSPDINKLLETPEASAEYEKSTYCDLLSAIDTDRLEGTLTEWGWKRFHNKVRRFNAALMLGDFDQVFYEGIMEALGYDKNKQNMLSLAQSLPLKKIRAWQAEGMNALELASIFCCASGLLARSKELSGEHLYNLLSTSYESQQYFAQPLKTDWQLFRVRPNSHPVYRLFTISSLLHKTANEGLLQYFLEHSGLDAGDAGHEYRRFHELFSDAVLPGAEALPKPGRGLTGNIFVNIFLPVAYVYFEKHSDTDALERILAVYKSFPALQENHILRHMGRYLSDGHVRAVSGKTILQQGLIEIFHRFCSYRLCQECVSSSQARL